MPNLQSLPTERQFKIQHTKLHLQSLKENSKLNILKFIINHLEEYKECIYIHHKEYIYKLKCHNLQIVHPEGKLQLKPEMPSLD